MNIKAVRPNLYLISLKQDMRGFENAISSWFFDGRFKFLVDVGPRSSVGILLESLKKLNVQRLDCIFLTHIHIDHGGAIGTLIKSFPETKVICHPMAVKHLIDPRRLWEGSKKVLGDIALKYGEIEPLDAKNIISSSDFISGDFMTIETPGHASHHISIIYDRCLFSGEAGGVFRDLGGKIYMRPASPPGFIWNEAVRSIDRLMEFGDREICYAHFGIHPDAREMLRRHKEQLYIWRDVITEQLKNDEGKEMLDRCIKVLLERDGLFKNFHELSLDEKEMESYFVKNSIRGLMEDFS